jgi:hypothetical protein
MKQHFRAISGNSWDCIYSVGFASSLVMGCSKVRAFYLFIHLERFSLLLGTSQSNTGVARKRLKTTSLLSRNNRRSEID